MSDDEYVPEPELRRAASDRERKPSTVYAGGVCASNINAEAFALRHPLVEVSTGLVSKFDDGKRLDKEVENYILEQVILQMQLFGKCYAPFGHISKELAYRPVICSMLPVFTQLAPRLRELLDGEESRYQNKNVSLGFEQQAAGIQMEIDDESGSSEAWSFTDLSGWSFTGAGFKHEDGTYLKSHEAVDVRGYVMDSNLPKDPTLPRSIFEMKGFGDWILFVNQALYYGCGAALQNINWGRFKKVYVTVLGIGWLGCAEIDPIGYLEVGNKNNLTLVAIRDFKKQVSRKCDWLEKKGKMDQVQELKDKYCNVGDKELRDKFADTMKLEMDDAARKLNDTCKAVYMPLFKEKTKVLVAKATYRDETLRMLRYPVKVSGKAKLLDDRLALTGIARIVFGDRVLKWKLPAVLAHAERRKQEALHEAKSIISAE